MAADIRPAHADDVDALAAMEIAVFPTDRLSRRSFRRLIASSSAALFVALASSAIVGYAVVLFRSGSRTARLYSIAASNAPRGTGRALLNAAEQEAAGRGASALRLEVRQDNPRAIALYERSGYQPAGLEASYYADGMAALRFRKPLSAELLRAGTAP